jgi:hypothetical protein
MHQPPRCFTRRLELALVAVVLLAGLADAVSTAVGLHHGARELNSGAIALMQHIGLIPVLALRVVPPAAGAFLLLRWASRDRVIFNAAVSALIVVVLGWTAIAASNSTVVL